MSSSAIGNIFVEGPRGPQGPRGPRGLTGATGPTGPTGASGPYALHIVNTSSVDKNIIFELSDGTTLEVVGNFRGATFFDPNGAIAVNSLISGYTLYAGYIPGGTFYFRGLCATGSLYLEYSGQNNEYIALRSIYSGLTFIGNYDALSIQNYSLLYLKQNNLAAGTPVKISFEQNVFGQDGAIDLLRSNKESGASADFGFNLNSGSTIKYYTSKEKNSTPYNINIKEAGTHVFQTPTGISGFVINDNSLPLRGVTYSKNEIISTTLVFTSDDVWTFPQNVYFEQGENYLSCGTNIIGIMSYDGGETWLASVSQRGHGVRDPNSQCVENYLFGSCCHENVDGTLECEDYVQKEYCDAISGSFNPMKPCSESCGTKIGLCCANGKCIENTPVSECDLFGGIFYQDITCDTYPNNPDGPNYGEPIETGRLCYNSCISDSQLVCCKDNKCLGNYSRIQCEQILGGKSIIGTCETIDCCDYTIDVGACCVCNLDGTSQCFDALTKSECDLLSGIFMGPKQRCEDISCGCVCGVERDASPPPPPTPIGYNCSSNNCIPVYVGVAEYPTLAECTASGCNSGTILGYNCSLIGTNGSNVCTPVYSGTPEYSTLDLCNTSCGTSKFECAGGICTPNPTGQYDNFNACIASGCTASTSGYDCINGICIPVGPSGAFATEQQCMNSGCENISWFICQQGVTCIQQTGISAPAGSFSTKIACENSGCGTSTPQGGICCKNGACLSSVTNATDCLASCGNWLDTMTIHRTSPDANGNDFGPIVLEETYQFGSNPNDCEFCSLSRPFFEIDYQVFQEGITAFCNPQIKYTRVSNDNATCCTWSFDDSADQSTTPPEPQWLTSPNYCTDLYLGKFGGVAARPLKIKFPISDGTITTRNAIKQLMTCPLLGDEANGVIGSMFDAGKQILQILLDGNVLPYGVECEHYCNRCVQNGCEGSNGELYDCTECRRYTEEFSGLIFAANGCYTRWECPPDYYVGCGSCYDTCGLGTGNNGECVQGAGPCIADYCDRRPTDYCPNSPACADPHPGICCKYVNSQMVDADPSLSYDLIGKATCLPQMASKTSCENAGGVWWDKIRIYQKDDDTANNTIYNLDYQFQSPGDCEFCERTRFVQKFGSYIDSISYEQFAAGTGSLAVGNRINRDDVINLAIDINQKPGNFDYEGSRSNLVNSSTLFPVSMGIKAGKQRYRRRYDLPVFSTSFYYDDTVDCGKEKNFIPGSAYENYDSPETWISQTGRIIHDPFYYENGLTFLNGGIASGELGGRDWLLAKMGPTETPDAFSNGMVGRWKDYDDSTMPTQCKNGTHWMRNGENNCQPCLREIVDSFLGCSVEISDSSSKYMQWFNGRSFGPINNESASIPMPLYNNLLANTFYTKLALMLYSQNSTELDQYWPNNQTSVLDFISGGFASNVGFSWKDCVKFCPDATSCDLGNTCLINGHPLGLIWQAHILGLFNIDANKVASYLGICNTTCECCTTNPFGVEICNTIEGDSCSGPPSTISCYGKLDGTHGPFRFSSTVYDPISVTFTEGPPFDYRNGAPNCYEINPLTGREFNSPIKNIKAFINNTEYMCVPVICFDDCSQFEICE